MDNTEASLMEKVLEVFREIAKELQELYGVTEFESINILFEHHVDDYVNRYYRMKNRIPNYVNQQGICDEVVQEYLLAM